MDGLLGERLNGEPVVFRGYTDSELLLAVAVSAWDGYSSRLASSDSIFSRSGL